MLIRGATVSHGKDFKQGLDVVSLHLRKLRFFGALELHPLLTLDTPGPQVPQHLGSACPQQAFRTQVPD